MGEEGGGNGWGGEGVGGEGEEGREWAGRRGGGHGSPEQVGQAASIDQDGPVMYLFDDLSGGL